MTKAQEIRAYIKANPGKTSLEISNAVNWTVQRVSAAMWTEMRKAKPVIRRETHHISITNTPVYTYFYDDGQPVRAEVKVEKPAVLREKPAVLTKRHHPTGSSIEDLADALAQAIASQVVGRVSAHIEQALRNIIPPTLVPKISIEQLTSNLTALPDLRPKKPSVLIAGLLPNQAGIISTEFGEVFDLRFFMTDDNLRHLKNMVAKVDHVFTFTSKVSHGVEEVMVSQGHKIHRCSGGMTMLKDQLLQLYAEGSPGDK